MKNYRMKLLLLTLAAMCLCAVQASALEYTYAGVDDFLFGRPTSDDTVRALKASQAMGRAA